MVPVGGVDQRTMGGSPAPSQVKLTGRVPPALKSGLLTFRSVLVSMTSAASPWAVSGDANWVRSMALSAIATQIQQHLVTCLTESMVAIVSVDGQRGSKAAVVVVRWVGATSGGTAVHREEAATLLGVAVDADLDEVRRAWRLWAKVAHPDVGGDPDHFARLQHAREILVQERPIGARNSQSESFEAPIRLRLRDVLRPPPRRVLAGLGALGALATAGLPHVLTASLSMPLALAAVPTALAATLWVMVTAKAVLVERADRGHRIALAMVLWLPLTASQVLLSIILTPSLVPVLPVLALPIVTVVAASNFTAHGGFERSTSREPLL